MLEPLGLAFPQYICMRILSRFPDRSNAELARDTNVSPQAMNMVLRGLEERGLVTRPASVSSGRSLPAALTREGEELLEKTDAGVRDSRAPADGQPVQPAARRLQANPRLPGLRPVLVVAADPGHHEWRKHPHVAGEPG